jgi:hypothetical protein
MTLSNIRFKDQCFPQSNLPRGHRDWLCNWKKSKKASNSVKHTQSESGAYHSQKCWRSGDASLHQETNFPNHPKVAVDGTISVKGKIASTKLTHPALVEAYNKAKKNKAHVPMTTLTTKRVNIKGKVT